MSKRGPYRPTKPKALRLFTEELEAQTKGRLTTFEWKKKQKETDGGNGDNASDASVGAEQGAGNDDRAGD